MKIMKNILHAVQIFSELRMELVHKFQSLMEQRNTGGYNFKYYPQIMTTINGKIIKSHLSGPLGYKMRSQISG